MDIKSMFLELMGSIKEMVKSLRVLQDSVDDTIEDYSTIVPYQELSYSIPAGGYVDVFQVFDYFRVITLSNATLDVSFGDNGIRSPFTGAGIGLKCKTVFRRVRLYNTGGSTITTTIALALGAINDDRLTVSGTVSISGIVQTFWSTTTGIDTLQNTVSTTAVRLDNGSGGSSAQTTIYAGTSDLYIGETSGVTTANGFLIPANGSYSTSQTVGYAGQIWGIRAAGSATAFTIREHY